MYHIVWHYIPQQSNIVTENYIGLVVCFLLGNSPVSKILYADVSEHCLLHLHRRVGMILHTFPPMKMEKTECSETSAYKIQTPGNYPEENIQHTEHGESLKSSILVSFFETTQSCRCMPIFQSNLPFPSSH